MAFILRATLAAILVLASGGIALARPELGELFSGPELYRRLARQNAMEYRIPYAIVDAVMRVESNYDPHALGEAGEVGLMQVMPSTAAILGYTGSLEGLTDPATNIQYGTRYLADAWRLADGDICTAVMKYRAGHGETHFSEKSVSYCVRVRENLRIAGYPVAGKIPKPTFGFGKAKAGSGKITKLPSGRLRMSFPGL
ncbi:MAG: transglycosylase SLT domain-containing protein [Hyphomicrobiales bacterium]